MGLEPCGGSTFQSEGVGLAEVDERAGIAFSLFVFRRWGAAGAFHFVDGVDGGKGQSAKGFIKRDFGAAAGLAVENEGGGDFCGEHFLKTDRLSADLDFIGAVGFGFAALVFDRNHAAHGFQI